MRVAITGATGFIGSRLAAELAAAGHELVPIGRAAAPGGVHWDPAAGRIDAARLEGVDAAIHLAGESLNGRWTAAKKQRIVESRLRGTALLAQALAGLRRRPATLISASAVGYYGARASEEELDETSAGGTGFLASLAHDWERAAAPAEGAGIRVVHPRLGVVLGPGGALAAMLPPFRLGLGGPIGSGRQAVSWIALDDVARAMLHMLGTPALRGPVNFTSPNPATFNELAATLGRVLHRPAVLRLPGWAARLALGEMAEEMLLGGQRVLPRALLASGFRFELPGLEEALRRALGRGGAGPNGGGARV